MRIVICNIALREGNSKTTYPPLGALAIIQSLQSAGYDAIFYDINFFRPNEEELKKYFLKNRFDVVGISATVSTSYKFVKKLSSLIKSVSQETIIIVGGGLTASAELILKLNPVDFCVIGEGEKIVVNLIDYLSSNDIDKDKGSLKKIKGLCFLDRDGRPVFTGYEDQLGIDQIQDADYRIVEKFSDIGQYIINPAEHPQFRFHLDKGLFQEHRKNKKLATILTSRGCVNRCTFCYRWQQGIRVLPVDRVIENIKLMMRNYNVGFVTFGDENFGVTRSWLNEFTEKVEPLDILYSIMGICCENVDFEILRKLKKSGCLTIQYGFESGSNRILRVMEKRADAELNLRMARLTYEAGLETIPAVVIGMPGENYKTIEETSNFIKKATEFLQAEPIININALVVLPGTPAYEYARYEGLLGNSLAEEEKYLLRISGQGGDSARQLNLTDYPYFIVQGWVRCISIAARYNYHKKNAPGPSFSKLIFLILKSVFKKRAPDEQISLIIYRQPFIYRLRYVVSPILAMYKNLKEDRALFFSRCVELISMPFKRKKYIDYISLREFLLERVAYFKRVNPESIEALRLGR